MKNTTDDVKTADTADEDERTASTADKGSKARSAAKGSAANAAPKDTEARSTVSSEKAEGLFIPLSRSAGMETWKQIIAAIREQSPESIANQLDLPLDKIQYILKALANSQEVLPPNSKTTPYDDAFRTLVQELHRLLIKFVGAIFNEPYTGDEEITYGATERMVVGKDGKTHRRVLDSFFTIKGTNSSKTYHLECQSTPDNQLMYRIWQYGTTAAHYEVVNDNTMEITYPEGGVVYLRAPEKCGDSMTCRVKCSKGVVEHEIKVVQPRDFTAEKVLQEEYLFMLPFYLFRHEKELKKGGPEKREEVIKEIRMLQEGLQALEDSNRITAYEASVLRETFHSVANHLFEDPEIRKEVNDVMGGHVLDLESTRILNEGIGIGVERGIEIGVEIGVERGREGRDKEILQNLLAMNTPVPKIALALGVSEDEVLALIGS